MVKFGIGQPVRRKEDVRFITGTGRYTDDVSVAGQAHAYILRSPHAHASFKITDTKAAAKAPGVLAVLTHADLAADKVGNLACKVPITNVDGTQMPMPPRPALAENRARFVGDPIAVVVAETAAAARDAAELIEIDYETLPAVTDMERALQPGAPLVWDAARNNTIFEWQKGDAAATDAAFAKAKHVTKLKVVNNRIVVNSMEMRGALADIDQASGRLTLYISTQGSHSIQDQLAKDIFHVEKDLVRVVTPDVGGGFGMKLFLYPEYVLASWAARRLKRAVKWTCERSDAFLSDTHGRDNITEAELAIDGNGRFLAVRARTLANLGAYLSQYAPFIPTDCGTIMLPGVYQLEAAYVRVLGMMTHTVPVDAYRGAGRPEAAYVIERLVDAAAAELKMPADELRRRNFIAPEQMPYKTPMGQVYDSGKFAESMTLAMKEGDWTGFAARRADSKKNGKLRGLGLAYYVESCGAGPGEAAVVRVQPSGKVQVIIGTQSNGQGHETAYAQVVSESLGVAFEDVEVLQGDTDVVARGNGTGGSRSLPEGGVAIDRAIVKLVEKGKEIASNALEAAVADIEYRDARFIVAGTDRAVGIYEVAKLAADPKQGPTNQPTGLDGTDSFQASVSTYPNGCHVCEVEVDPETGVTSVLRHTVVDDFGRTINPLMLEGQVHGGIAQGIGQALLESCVYDDESGQLLTGSFMDYCMPRADSMPAIRFVTNNVPCTTNPLGIKGAGEAGAIGAPPAVINAIVDALRPLGIDHVDMPATPERIWRQIQAARPIAAD
jgi:carbon-monoxide dehydrogenase large subunit